MDTQAIMRADRARRLARIRAEDAVLEHAIKLRTSVECEGRNHVVSDHMRNPRACDTTRWPRGYRNGGRTVGTADGRTRSVKRIYADGTSEIVPTSSITGRRTTRTVAKSAPMENTTPETARFTPNYDASHVETY